MRPPPAMRTAVAFAVVLMLAAGCSETADDPAAPTTTTPLAPCDPDPIVIQLRDGHPTVDYTPSASPTELLEGAEVVLGRVRSGVRAEGWWSIEVETDDGVRRVSVPGRPEPGRLELTTEAPLVLAIGGPADDAPTGFAVVPEGLYVACEADDVAIAVVAAPSWALGTSLALLAG